MKTVQTSLASILWCQCRVISWVSSSSSSAAESSLSSSFCHSNGSSSSGLLLLSCLKDGPLSEGTYHKMTTLLPLLKSPPPLNHFVYCYLMFELHFAGCCMCTVWRQKTVFTFTCWQENVSLLTFNLILTCTYGQDFWTSQLVLKLSSNLHEHKVETHSLTMDFSSHAQQLKFEMKNICTFIDFQVIISYYSKQNIL